MSGEAPNQVGGPARPERIAHFRIVGILGRGGMGVVYRAHDETLRRDVALKLLPETEDEEGRQRFLREARSAAGVTHANVAVVHQVGDDAGRIYIAMELVEGESLRQRLARGRLEMTTALDLAAQIAQGMSAAHEKGIVHRDLKPENIMITPSGVVKLLDFGLAKSARLREPRSDTQAALAETETVVTSGEGRVMGTPEYMSPEQALGAPVDVRSDVFSFGVVLYEMLAGKRPFDGASTGAVLVAIARDTPRSLRSIAPHVDDATDAIVTRCLEKDSARRFANGAEILAALAGRSSARSASPGGSRTDVAPTTTRSAAPPSGRPGGLVLLGLLVAGAVAAGAWTMARRPAAEALPSPPSSAHAMAAIATPVSPRSYVERRLTAYPAENNTWTAELTPDAQTIVFSDTEGFWAQPVDGGVRRALGVPLARGDRPREISMFQDGKRVLVGVERDGRVTNWSAPLDGTRAERVQDGIGTDAYVSPDGTQVATCRQDSVQIVAIGGGPWTSLPGAADCTLARLRWSPDGRHIAVIVTGRGRELRTVSTDGKESKLVYASGDSLLESGLAWPEPGRILFAARTPKDSTAAVFEVAVDEGARPLGAPRELWKTRNFELGSLSAARNRIAMNLGQEQDDVYVAKLGDGGRRLLGSPARLSISDANDRTPRWMPDGRVVYYSERDGQGAVYAQTAGSPTADLLVAPPVAMGPVEVLLGGDLLYYRQAHGADASGDDGFIVRGIGSTVQEIAPGNPNTKRIRCAAGDPRNCVLDVAGSEEQTFARIDLVTGRTEAPFFHGHRSPNPVTLDFALSPDGSTIAFADWKSTVTSVRTADGAQRTFSTSPASTFLQTLDFTPDGKRLIVTGAHFGTTQHGILSVDLEGRGELLVSTPNVYYLYPAVSLDGRQLAWMQRTPDTDVWLLEEKR